MADRPTKKRLEAVRRGRACEGCSSLTHLTPFFFITPDFLGDGEHTAVAFVDDVELSWAMVRVATLGAESVEDVAGSCGVVDFPSLGEAVTLAWQGASQNLAMTSVE